MGRRMTSVWCSAWFLHGRMANWPGQKQVKFGPIQRASRLQKIFCELTGHDVNVFKIETEVTASQR